MNTRTMTQRYPLPNNIQLARGERAVVRIEQRSIALFNIDDVIYAIDDSCPHSGASLAGGKVVGRTVQCPAHGLRFDLQTGCMQPKTGLAVHSYPVSSHGGKLLVSLPVSEPAGSAP
jgi:3-phenylpropionate/trans-cinnamate dioxygenase ferredoxin subunit